MIFVKIDSELKTANAAKLSQSLEFFKLKFLTPFSHPFFCLQSLVLNSGFLLRPCCGKIQVFKYEESFIGEEITIAYQDVILMGN